MSSGQGGGGGGEGGGKAVVSDLCSMGTAFAPASAVGFSALRSGQVCVYVG